jgi:hypothetical protein
MQGAWLSQYIGAGIPILSQQKKIVLKRGITAIIRCVLPIKEDIAY